MVFESLVVDVLNRFLGDYVVNLDSSQLSLGIWGGKVLTVCQCWGVKACIDNVTVTRPCSCFREHMTLCS